MTIGPAPMCMECARYRDIPGRFGLTCDAYPDGIPDEILNSEVDHTKPYEGDGGQTFIAVEPERVGEVSGSPFLHRDETAKSNNEDEASGGR